MTKLNWIECGRSEPRYRTEYLGYAIWAIYDACPPNPFTDEDGHWPMSVYHGRDGFRDYDKGISWSIRNPFATFSDALLVHMQVHVARTLDITIEELLRDYHHADVPMSYCRDGAILRDCFNAHLETVRDGDLFDVLVKLYGLAGITAVSRTIHGYSQGDWAEVLTLAPPDLVAEWCPDIEPEKLTDNLSSQGQLYGWWAWGDTWGWRVTPLDDPHHTLEDCWGYYGPDFDENGIAEAAMAAVEGVVHAERVKRTGLLKRLIRNRVPLHLRPTLLNGDPACA